MLLPLLIVVLIFVALLAFLVQMLWPRRIRVQGFYKGVAVVDDEPWSEY